MNRRQTSYRKRKKEGLCLNCDSPSTKGLYCAKHHRAVRAWHKQNRIDNKARGLCGMCGKNKPPKGRADCRRCTRRLAVRRKKLHEKYLLDGTCIRCGKNPSNGCGQHCEKCVRRKKRLRKTNDFFLRRARSLKSSGERGILAPAELADVLRKLWNQQKGVCALSGRKLTKRNCEVDHKTPKSKGGKTIERNLRFLHRDVNQALRHLSDAAFLAICSDVISYSERS